MRRQYIPILSKRTDFVIYFIRVRWHVSSTSHNRIRDDQPTSWHTVMCQVGNGASKTTRVDDVQQHVEGRDDIEAHRIGQRQRRYTYISLGNQIIGKLRPESLNAGLSKIQSSDTAYTMLTPEFQPDV